MSVLSKKRPITESPTDPWMTLHSAALALGVTRHTVLIRALSGDLDAQVIAGRPVISRASVERALSQET